MKTITTRALLVLVGVAAAALLVAAPASAGKSGGTTLAPNHQTFEGFADIGIGVKTTGKAHTTSGGLHFPVVQAKVDPETGAAKFVHKGGLKFTYNGMSLKIKNLIVKIGAKNVIKAQMKGGGKVRFADLKINKMNIDQKKNGKFVYSNIRAFVAKPFAKAMTSQTGVQNLDGVKLGKLTTKAKA